MKAISFRRFDALAGYARSPMTYVIGEELGWYEHANERVLGLLIRDRADNDYGGMVFGRDQKARFRWIHGTSFFQKKRVTEAKLRQLMEKAALESDEDYHQGDEKGPPIDFFGPSVPEANLNPSFAALRDKEEYSGARGIIEPMMRWYEDVDGNFVEQFQTTGFDARIFELYLFAAFHEMGFEIDRSFPAPDFACDCPGLRFFVEATTVNPTKDNAGNDVPEPKLTTPEEFKAYLADYMPIKFGSALYSKLRKKYWEKQHVKDMPFMIALHDFSGPRSMTRTKSAFENYVYGYEHDWDRDKDGKLRIHPRKIEKHSWGGKEIPSGFFDQPDAENVSAVLFSNSGTISKFNRMGLLAGFGSPRLRLVRQGFAVNHDPNASSPLPFRVSVNDPDYSEIWSEGLDIWHNPKAKHPLPKDAFPFAAHHELRGDGQIVSTTPDFHPLGSFTLHSLDQQQPKASEPLSP